MSADFASRLHQTNSLHPEVSIFGEHCESRPLTAAADGIRKPPRSPVSLPNGGAPEQVRVGAPLFSSSAFEPETLGRKLVDSIIYLAVWDVESNQCLLESEWRWRWRGGAEQRWTCHNDAFEGLPPPPASPTSSP
ncbi:hypothetical protein FQA47_012116 [Oryzias melastigma]|uniref:Uncharacterized protein n=1 Tax=Oryzias melastigma TaxID=30732 RepID=A0A834CEZ9_ORYME|nr:hypothetical protein FQA47_012116 [Oryzias melastigma]